MSDDYSTFTTFTHDRDDVVAALTTLEGLAGWWTDVSGDAHEDGDLNFTFGDDSNPLRIHVDVARADLVRWTVLGYAPVPDWTGTVLHYSLDERSGGGCELSFRHEGLTPLLDCFDSCRASWDHFLLSSLHSYVETGVGHPRGSAADLAWRDAFQAASS